MKENDLDKYVRIKLGQDFNSPKYIKISDETTEINQVEYNLLPKAPNRYDDRVDGQKYTDDFKNKHLRFDFDAKNNIENNRKICDLFEKDLNSNKIVFHSSKGVVCVYIISSQDYSNRYWGETFDGCNGNLHPYKYNENVSGESTVDIIKKLIIKSKNYILSNNCNFSKGLCEDCGTSHKNRKWNKCNRCIKNICFDCGKTMPKGNTYPRCYACNEIKKLNRSYNNSINSSMGYIDYRDL